ncbi:PAS domain-containing hybrid sensor histidine kinase/response regulator [Geoalkalibacter sp.]|uniref:PAS domain-containing hybrid sensor histidine kinase/response regulator n=1 Tax=Geoalkalibacter sp. TaxID=3041440 RepID=UPI00272E8FAA|nr:PAS domain-containing hybrid sensor histidine kinase/response regulator [Geoalkalibacter sp.]
MKKASNPAGQIPAEERLKRFIGTMDEIVFEFDAAGRYLNVWSENEKLLKIPREELLGKRIDEVLPPDLAAKVHELFTHIRATGKSSSFEYSLDVPEGKRWFLARISLVPSLDGEEPTFSYLGRDITEQKNLEQSLRASERRFHDLVDTINDWVWEVDEKGVYTYANPRVYNLLGYRPEEVVGKSPFDLMPEEEAARIAQKFAEISAKAEPFSALENINRHKDGRIVILETSGLPFFDDQGRLIGYRGVDRDITERKASAERLRLAKEAAERATLEKSRFLATMSHEIRTPMAVVLGALEFLGQEDLGAERNHFVRMAEGAAKSLMELIGDILDFSRIEAGKLQVKNLAFSLRRCVAEAVELLRRDAEKKGLKLNLAIDARVPDALLGDPARLHQILVNLIGNAIKFTRQGQIQVLVACDPCPQSPTTDPQLRFCVQDTGIGIAAGLMDRLFESFSQGDHSDTREHGGTGLGLAICKGIVERLGGQITATSIPGQGSRFSFTLPLCLAAAPEPEKFIDLPRAAPSDAVKIRVLLGEDDLVLRKLMETLMAKRGWEFLTVENGLAVIEAWRREPFDLILMDAQMPRLDGYEATRRIREMEKATGGHIPIIALTAHAGTDSEQRALAAGMDAFLTKPIRMSELYERIEKFLPEKMAQE